MLNIRMLCTPYIEMNGSPVFFPYRRADALLYYMAVRKTATRQELISLLWEDYDEASALKYLRQTLYVIKKELGADILVSPQRSTVILNPLAEIETDYDRFTESEDNEYYKGAFLNGFSVKRAPALDEWISLTRETLRTAHLSKLEKAARACAGDSPEKAALYAEEYLYEEPYDEALSCFLMNVYSGMTQYSKAANVYIRQRDRLAADLGIEPQETTTQLYYETMNRWNATSGADVSGSSPREIISGLYAENGNNAQVRSETEQQIEKLEYRIMALSLNYARAYVPFAPVNSEDFSLPEGNLQAEFRSCSEELAQLKEISGGLSSFAWGEHALLLANGQYDLFRGRTDQGIRQLEEYISLEGTGKTKKLEACCTLAQAAVYRQEKELAEHYAAMGLKYLDRGTDKLYAAWLHRIRGCCFCLRKSYDKASYYLLEAIEILEKMPGAAESRLQLAAAYADYGRVCRYMHGFAEASSYFKKSLEIIGDACIPGKTWIYVHYGRTVYVLEDNYKAADLFRAGYENALKTGELWGRTAAAAYAAYFSALDGDTEKAAECLACAQATSQAADSPLETGILLYVSMLLKRLVQNDPEAGKALSGMLKFSEESYSRQGVRVLADVPDVFEAELLAKNLRDGLIYRQTPRALDLYSRKRHFMTE